MTQLGNCEGCDAQTELSDGLCGGCRDAGVIADLRDEVKRVRAERDDAKEGERVYREFVNAIYAERLLDWCRESGYEEEDGGINHAKAMDALIAAAKRSALLPSLLTLHTQDNRITHEPVFVVEQKQRVWGFDPAYADSYAWLDADNDHNEASEEEAKALDAKYIADEDTGSWMMVHYRDRWEFVTACFTEAGCEAYLKLNGHNLNETRIYVHSGYRNGEWIAVRAALMVTAAVMGDDPVLYRSTSHSWSKKTGPAFTDLPPVCGADDKKRATKEGE